MTQRRVEPARLRPVAGSAAEIVVALRQWLGDRLADPLSGAPDGGTDDPGTAEDTVVVRTSGSTGAPKAVVLSARALLSSAHATHRRLGGPGQWLLALPPTYVAGLQVLVRSLLAGHEPVLADPRLDGDDLADAVAAMRGPRRYLSLVPTQLHRLAVRGELGPLTDLDAVLIGGAALRPELRRLVLDAGVRVVTTYGMSETCGGCVYDGLPLDGVQVRVEDPSDGAGRSGVGQVLIGGDVVFDGYADDPAATAEVLDGGWLRTSDLGRFDEDGRLRLLGRVDDVAVSGGLNVPLGAVTSRLQQLPEALDALAVGAPDPEWGTAVVACLAVGDRRGPSLDRVRDFCADELPRTWAPRRLLTMPSLPLLDSGKVDGVALATRAQQHAPSPPATTRPSRSGRAGDLPPLQWRCYAIEMTTRFRGITHREGMLTRGPAGWAEWSPFWDYDLSACRPWLAAALESAYQPWPTPVRDRVPVNCTVPAVDPARAAEIVHASSGCRTAKVKVAEPGQCLADDIARVESVTDALGPGGRVRVDANGGWAVDQAVAAIRELDRAAGGLEYVEQPCPSVEELALVRRRVQVPIAADESIRRAEDPYRVRDLAAADIAVLKVQPLGGIRACLRIAQEIGLPVVVSSALETSVGIAAGVAVAAALPDLPYACGLATVALLRHDVAAEPLLPVDGHLPVGRPQVGDWDEVDPSAAGRWSDRLAGVRALEAVKAAGGTS